MKKSLLNMHHAHCVDQRAKMKKLLEAGHCPFCPEHLEKYHDNPIETWGPWIVTKNDYPYKGTRLHYLFICRRHITRTEELSPAEWEGLLFLISSFNQKHKVKGGAIVMRFGETDYTGGSVDHLHLHLIVGGKRRPKAEPLSAYIGYQT